MPIPDEARILRLRSGVPVRCVSRVGRSDDLPVEAAEITLPGDRIVLEYHLEFSWPQHRAPAHAHDLLAALRELAAWTAHVQAFLEHGQALQAERVAGIVAGACDTRAVARDAVREA